MNPLIAFVLAFLLYGGIYLSGVIRVFQRRFGWIGYWTAVSIFTVVFAVLMTLLCPELYFVRWSFPVDYFIIFLSLSLLILVPDFYEFRKLVELENTGNEEVELAKSMGFWRAAVFQVISAAFPEELVFRYVFLGLLALWNPLAGLVALSLFFGIGHKFSHPDRNWNLLISATLMGFVLGLAYLYTKSLLVVLAIHWLVDMIPWAYIKYGKLRRVIAGSTALLAVLPLVLLWGKIIPIIDWLIGIYSNEGLILGSGIAMAMLGIVYLGPKLLKGRKS